MYPRALKELSEVADTIMNPEIEKWKDPGGKVLGYFCNAMPVEICTAAGILPFRLRATGSTATDLSDQFFSNINCSFPRHAFNCALKGDFDFLDALVMFNSCDHVRRIYDHWIRELKTPFVRIIGLPKKDEQPQVDYFREDLVSLIQDMQTELGVTITDNGLKEAIKLHNESRRLMREFYELRKGDNPPITGAEMLAVTVAGTAIPQKKFNELLKELLNDLRNIERKSDSRARLMVIGAELDNPEFLKVIEDQGGLVVTDSLCFGSRLLWVDVNEDIDDPLTALAQYYVADRPSCARMFTKYDRRSEYIQNMIKDFRVDGVIFERMLFCDAWGFEQFSVSNDFKEWDIPLLCIDREYTLGGVGQLRTRVQAFLETFGR